MDGGLNAFERRVLDDLSAIREDMSKRFAVLELHDRDTFGNGQPGWKKDHGRRISRLEKWVVGCSAGGAVVGVALKWGVEALLR
jgi:hypothetical protein